MAIGPHTKEIADALKEEKLEELKARPVLLMTGLEKAFEGYRPRISVIITGENSRIPEDLQALAEFTALEMDPVRRSALIEMAMRKKGLDVGALPKSPPPPPMEPNQTLSPTSSTKRTPAMVK